MNTLMNTLIVIVFLFLVIAGFWWTSVHQANLRISRIKEYCNQGDTIVWNSVKYIYLGYNDQGIILQYGPNRHEHIIVVNELYDTVYIEERNKFV